MRNFFRVNYSPDEGSVGGDQGGESQTPGWIAALPDELKGNDYVKTFEKPGDFVKAALDIKTEHEALKPRLETAIFKPGEGSTPEEISAYHKAIGVPDSKDGYEFQATEGIKQDENLLSWAKDTFHNLGVPSEQATGIVKAWDVYQDAINKTYQENITKGIEEAQSKLKDEWKADYDKNIAETQRGFEAFEKAAPGFSELLEMDTANGIKVGNHPAMLKAFHAIYKAIGDDNSFSGATARQEEDQKGFQSIYKTPNPS